MVSGRSQVKEREGGAGPDSLPCKLRENFREPEYQSIRGLKKEEVDGGNTIGNLSLSPPVNET